VSPHRLVSLAILARQVLIAFIGDAAVGKARSVAVMFDGRRASPVAASEASSPVKSCKSGSCSSDSTSDA